MRRRIVVITLAMLLLLLAVSVGSGLYMLQYALSPELHRSDVDSCLYRQFARYPETRQWWDSLQRCHAVADTFLLMPNGERHHALYINGGVGRTAFIVHGWRNCSIDFLYLARMYSADFGYNVVLPDLHAHGMSDGDAIGMGWHDKEDVLRWITLFRPDSVVVHGVSMGAATTMMLSADSMPSSVRWVRLVEDCGYTSVWDEFAWQLKCEFGLPTFPVLYAASALCKLKYGWRFGEASALACVQRSDYPMLFIHGTRDTFVPTAMVFRLYSAKAEKKQLWLAPGSEHAQAYKDHREEYRHRVDAFLRSSW